MPETAPKQTLREINVDSDAVRNWVERKEVTDGACVKKIDATPTTTWRRGWYRNPSSGRSRNFGLNTRNPHEHATVIVKGGCFFVDEKCKEFCDEHSVALDELYGGLSLAAAQKEYAIAARIQKVFRQFTGRSANCPQPIDVTPVAGIVNKSDEAVSLEEFFTDEQRRENGKTNFTIRNFVDMASKLGIDALYPMSDAANEEVKKDPYRWLFRQCLKKKRQGVYRYLIQGPNTRLRDLMMLDLAERRRRFIEANGARDVSDAAERFSAKLGEFYGVLHKSNISYHGGRSEHCTLVDTTIAGVVMDIGGLSEDAAVSPHSEAYAVQIIKTTNLIAYVCQNILKADAEVTERALAVFWERYKSFYVSPFIESFSQKKQRSLRPDAIRTQYFDAVANEWMRLAPDLQYLYDSGA